MTLKTAIKTHPLKLFWVGALTGLLLGVLLGYQTFKNLNENVQNAVLKSGKTTINSYDMPGNGS